MAEVKYTVKAGDTLSGIGAKYGLSYNQSLSNISGYGSGNPNLIRPNEVLTIKTVDAPVNAPPKFNDTTGVQDYLNTRQNDFFTRADDSSFDLPKLDSESFDLAKISKEIEGLLPTTQAPVAPKLTEQFQQLRSDYNLEALEGQINELTAMEDQIAATLRINKFAERNKPVASNVIEGRISEQEFQAREDYDFVARQKSRLVDQVQTAYGVIETMMTLTQKDFENARTTYNDELDRAYKAISLAQGERSFRFDVYQHEQTVARSNAQIMVNLLQKGNISLDSMPKDQKVQLNKLELQAGLPVGFFQSIKMDAGANIVSTSSYKGQTQVLMRQADGSLKLETYGTRDEGGSSTQGSEAFQTAEIEFTSALRNVAGKDGYVSPETYRRAAQDWVTNTPFSLEEFNNTFKTFANPSHYQDYNPDKKSSDSGYQINIQ